MCPYGWASALASSWSKLLLGANEATFFFSLADSSTNEELEPVPVPVNQKKKNGFTGFLAPF